MSSKTKSVRTSRSTNRTRKTSSSSGGDIGLDMKSINSLASCGGYCKKDPRITGLLSELKDALRKMDNADKKELKKLVTSKTVQHKGNTVLGVNVLLKSMVEMLKLADDVLKADSKGASMPFPASYAKACPACNPRTSKGKAELAHVLLTNMLIDKWGLNKSQINEVAEVFNPERLAHAKASGNPNAGLTAEQLRLANMVLMKQSVDMKGGVATRRRVNEPSSPTYPPPPPETQLPPRTQAQPLQTHMMTPQELQQQQEQQQQWQQPSSAPQQIQTGRATRGRGTAAQQQQPSGIASALMAPPMDTDCDAIQKLFAALAAAGLGYGLFQLFYFMAPVGTTQLSEAIVESLRDWCVGMVEGVVAAVKFRNLEILTAIQTQMTAFFTWMGVDNTAVRIITSRHVDMPRSTLTGLFVERMAHWWCRKFPTSTTVSGLAARGGGGFYAAMKAVAGVVVPRGRSSRSSQPAPAMAPPTLDMQNLEVRQAVTAAAQQMARDMLQAEIDSRRGHAHQSPPTSPRRSASPPTARSTIRRRTVARGSQLGRVHEQVGHMDTTLARLREPRPSGPLDVSPTLAAAMEMAASVREHSARASPKRSGSARASPKRSSSARASPKRSGSASTGPVPWARRTTSRSRSASPRASTRRSGRSPAASSWSGSQYTGT